MVEIRKSVQWA